MIIKKNDEVFMFKKIVIFGLLTITQASPGMDSDISTKELEKEYKYFWALESDGLDARPDWKAWQQENQEFWERERFKRRAEEYKGYAKTAASEYAKLYAAAYSLTLAHEMGHWFFARALLKDKGFIWISPLQLLPFNGFHCHVPTTQIIKHFIHNPKDVLKGGKAIEKVAGDYYELHLKDKVYSRRLSATMLAAGPISGCLASYLLLKGNTFYNIYEKNGGNLQKALQETQEKSLFNSNQNFLLQFIAAMDIQLNLFGSFYPWGNKPTADGDRMFDVLNIKNPRPLLRKTIGMSLGTLTFCALGKAILDAWTK